MCQRCLGLVLGVVVVAMAAGAMADDGAIGFSGTEFHKVGWGTYGLRIADVNGDGLNDILLVNNAKARVECLIQRKDPSKTPDLKDLEPNEIPDDKRFKSRPFLSEKRIYSLAVGDLNGDGRTDMAYYGDPRELVVVYQNEKGKWGKRRTFDITDGSRSQHGLVVGDVNGDGRNDLVLLASDGAYFVVQDAKGKLGAPAKESGVPSGTVAVDLRDFNGDKRLDLVSLTFDDPEPFSIRFQGEDGQLGPETRVTCDAVRAVDFGDINGDGGDEVLAVKRNSGMLMAYSVRFEGSVDQMLDGALARFTLRGTSARRPPALAMGRFTHPNRIDLIVTATATNEVELFKRSAAGHWAGRLSFPVLEGVTQLAVIDSDGDGKDELLLLSADEKMLGHAKVDKRGRLSFPLTIPVVGEPSCMAVADLNGDGRDEILYTASEGRKHSLRIIEWKKVADAPKAAWHERLSVPIKDTRFGGQGLMVMDVNQDGKQDILVFLRHEAMRVFKAGGGKYVDVSLKPDYGKGLVQQVKKTQVGVADIDGDGKPELLVARRNFARALRMDKDDRLSVVDQFNGRLPQSRIVGVAGADLDGDGKDEILLLDGGAQSLSALKKNKMGVYTIVENYKVSDVGLVERLIIRNVTGGKREDIVMLTQAGCYVLQPGRPRLTLKKVASYETPRRNGRLDDLILGDLNRDGKEELLITESTKNNLEVVAWDGAAKSFVRKLAWPVYEARAFSRRGRGRNGGGAREFAIADVTNDKKQDIILLIHDRILVYPQE
jgi:FG-GAP-like repeat